MKEEHTDRERQTANILYSIHKTSFHYYPKKSNGCTWRQHI